MNGAGRFEQIGIELAQARLRFATRAACAARARPPAASQILGIGCSDPYSAGSTGSAERRWRRAGRSTRTPASSRTRRANPSWSGSTGAAPRVRGHRPRGERGHRRTTSAKPSTSRRTTRRPATTTTTPATSELIVTGGPTNFAFATAGFDRTACMQAIRAWADVEPGVTLTDVHVPGDGLFVVGSHATDLGGGMWHYEFAVHNMNCGSRERIVHACRSGTGVTITNVGFHDITYRNGDGQGNVTQSGADWTPTRRRGCGHLGLRDGGAEPERERDPLAARRTTSASTRTWRRRRATSRSACGRADRRPR